MKIRKPHIATASATLEFAAPQMAIRFEQKRVEEAFGSLAGVQSQATNVPNEAPPQVPRIVLPAGKKAIAISQVGIQMDFKFDAGDIGAQFDVIEKSVVEFHSAAESKFLPKGFRTVAIILNVQYPSEEDSSVLQEFLLDKFFRKPDVGMELATAQMALGFKADDLFINLAANVYEDRQIEFKPKAGTVLMFSSADAKVVAQGLAFKFDINNRPNVEAGKSIETDVGAMCGRLRNFLRESFPKITGLDLL